MCQPSVEIDKTPKFLLTKYKVPLKTLMKNLQLNLINRRCIANELLTVTIVINVIRLDHSLRLNVFWDSSNKDSDLEEAAERALGKLIPVV